MDRQSTIAFILIGVILVFWLYMNAPEPQNIPNQQQDTTQVAETLPEKSEEQGSNQSLEENKKVNDFEIQQATPSSFTERIITVETDLAIIEFTTSGARIKKFYLKDYETWYHNKFPDSANFYQTQVQLINASREGGDFNIVFVTKDGQLINTKTLEFSTELNKAYYNVPEGDSLLLSFSYNAGEGRTLFKNFLVFSDNYNNKVDIILDNMDDVISSYRYDVEWANGINFVEENSVDEANHSNAAAYSGDEKVVVDASSVGDNVEKVLNGKVDWVGVRNKYFAVIIAPENPSSESGADFKGEHIENKYGVREYYSASLRIPFNNKNFQKDSFKLFIGPLEYDILKESGHNFESMFEFGSFLGLSFITRPISEYVLLPLFKFLHQFIPNYGWVIIVFSIILKFALHPLTKQSYKSMKRMSQLQPKIAELKEKYKGDQQKIQKETMKLYSTYGVNPAGGCLPMLLQMPILFALFTFFNVAIEIRHEPFMFWITNLSAPDVIYNLPFKLPLFGISAITGLAPLLGITMFFQQKMTVKDPNQKAMVYIMPFVFTFMFMGFSSGLNLYYFMFNLLSIGQQYFINKQKGDELKPVDKPKKKPGFMQRMMEAAEQQQKVQKQAAKKRKK